LLKDVLRLREVGTRIGPLDLPFEGRLLSCRPELSKSPLWVIQEQAGEPEQPQEQEQVETDVEM
jgi:hypothetical protein